MYENSEITQEFKKLLIQHHCIYLTFHSFSCARQFSCCFHPCNAFSSMIAVKFLHVVLRFCSYSTYLPLTFPHALFFLHCSLYSSLNILRCSAKNVLPMFKSGEYRCLSSINSNKLVILFGVFLSANSGFKSLV